MITANILHKEKIKVALDPGSLDKYEYVWRCHLSLTDGNDTYGLIQLASINTVDLDTYFQAQAKMLWKTAEKKKQTDRLWTFLPEQVTLEALSEVLRQEVNALRQKAGLREYVREEWEHKIQDEINASSSGAKD